MAEFLTAYKRTAQAEGGYVNDPNDNGGETYCGISRVNFPKWQGWPIIDKMKPLKKYTILSDEKLISLVRQFYYSSFWQAVGGDDIEDQEIANRLYDFGVNAGRVTSLKQIQEVLGIPQTGKVDAHTIEAINNPNQYLLNNL